MPVINVLDARWLHVSIVQQRKRCFIVTLNNNRTTIRMLKIQKDLPKPHGLQTNCNGCHVLSLESATSNHGLKAGSQTDSTSPKPEQFYSCGSGRVCVGSVKARGLRKPTKLKPRRDKVWLLEISQPCIARSAIYVEYPSIRISANCTYPTLGHYDTTNGWDHDATVQLPSCEGW